MILGFTICLWSINYLISIPEHTANAMRWWGTAALRSAYYRTRR